MPPALSALSSALLTSPRPNGRVGVEVAMSVHGGGDTSFSPLRPGLQGPSPSALFSAAYALFLVARKPRPAAADVKRRVRARARSVPARSQAQSVESREGNGSGIKGEGENVNEYAESRQTEPELFVDPEAAEAARDGKNLSLVSDLRVGGTRDITVVTTASLPWMTGTAVNPLLRVIYLARDGHRVNLVVPWVAEAIDQSLIYPSGTLFSSAEEQARVIRSWADAQVPDVQFEILYYPAVYSKEFGCILPVGDITSVFDQAPINRDVCVLEEPEHLTWHHAGEVWTQLFRLVVGVIHTNYLEYCRSYGVFGPQYAFAFSVLNSWVCRSYCHRVIKLSDALQDFPLSVTCNVHGVRDRFIQIGKERDGAPFPRGAYFLGKVLWAKGYRELIDLMEDHFYQSGRSDPLPIDFFGAGNDADAVHECIRNSPALSLVTFHARVADHAGDFLQGYKVFVNASRSDVVCTATAEAIAMGKFAVVLDHPSNEFFRAFPNCLVYRTPEEFAQVVKYALNHEPVPLQSLDAYRLSWEAATERFYDAVRMPPSMDRQRKVDRVLASTHSTLSKLYPQPGKDIKRAKSRESLRHLAASSASPA